MKEAEKLAHRKEHFDNILNRPEPEQVAEILPAAEDVKAAIKVIKSGKACEADGVRAEMLKAEETETQHLLMCIFRETWESETIPEVWKTRLIVKLPKKGDLGNCDNWRGATLLPITS